MKNRYEIELAVELPKGVVETIRAKFNQADGLDETDWLTNEIQKAVTAVLLARTEEPGCTVHVYRAHRWEEPPAWADDDSFEVETHRAYATPTVPALGPIAEGKVRRLFAKGAADSEAREATA